MTDIERNNRIDEYLTWAMSESEQAAFEKDLAEDKNLSDEVDAQRTIAEAVQTAHLTETPLTACSPEHIHK